MGGTRFRLGIEPVPGSSWYRDLSRLLSEVEWKEIRERVLHDSAGSCAACTAVSGLVVDAVWSYDDARHLQKLEGFVALCSRCHALKNFDFERQGNRQAGIPLDVLANHFLEVNHCRHDTFAIHFKESRLRYQRRSRHTWTADLSKKAAYLPTGIANSAAPAAPRSPAANWLDRMQRVDAVKRHQEESDERTLKSYYQQHGIQAVIGKPYRAPDMRRKPKRRGRKYQPPQIRCQKIKRETLGL